MTLDRYCRLPVVFVIAILTFVLVSASAANIAPPAPSLDTYPPPVTPEPTNAVPTNETAIEPASFSMSKGGVGSMPILADEAPTPPEPEEDEPSSDGDIASEGNDADVDEGISMPVVLGGAGAVLACVIVFCVFSLRGKPSVKED